MKRRSRITNFLAVALLILLPTSSYAVNGERWQLTAEEWSRPRSGEVVLEMPAIRQAVNTWMKTPSTTIVITYPGGETGLLWAQEVFSWMVALGIPSEHLLTRSGSPQENLVLLELLAENE